MGRTTMGIKDLDKLNLVKLASGGNPYLSVILKNQRRVAKLPFRRGNPCWASE